MAENVEQPDPEQPSPEQPSAEQPQPESVSDPAETGSVLPPTSWDLQWYDDEAGPVVRPYAMTRGRTRPSGDTFFDLISLVTVVDRAESADPGSSLEPGLDPEHYAIVELCRREVLSVAEIGSAMGLPLGVVRVLLGDLDDAGLVSITRPVPPARLPDERILREVINGLRAL